MPTSDTRSRRRMLSSTHISVSVATAFSALMLTTTSAQAQAPVGAGNKPITMTGWNANIINSAGGPNVDAFDFANSFGYFANGYGGSYAGLPSDGSSIFDGNTYQFQAYTGNDALFLSTNAAAQTAYGLSTTGTLTLGTATSYQTLSILATSANASSTSSNSVTLNFSDGSSDAYTYYAPDWFNTGTGQFALSAKVARSNTNGAVSGTPFGITEDRITLSTADAAKKVSSMTFAAPTNAAETAIFAVSGNTGSTSSPSVVNSISIAGGGFTTKSGFIINGLGTGASTSGTTTTSGYIKQLSATTSVLQLTDGTGSEASSAFSSNKVSVAGAFNASFSFTKSGGADGLTFILQNNSPYSVGATGGGLGYTGTAFTNSIGVALNDYTTSGVALVTNGSIGSTTAPTASFETGALFTANVAYDGTNNLLVTILNSSSAPIFTQSYAVGSLSSLLGGSSAYIGFTGATGGVSETQDIYGLTFTGAGATPEPATLALLPVGLVGLAGVIRRRRAA